MESILLLQNDLLVGEGLRRAIDAEPGLRVVELAGSLEQARQHLSGMRTALLIADLRIGDRRLTELLRERCARGLQGRPQVLVIAMSASDPHLMQALRHGAGGYFVHGDRPEALSRVIRQMLIGESPMSAPIARRLLAHFNAPSLPSSRGAAAKGATELGDADRQMLTRVSQGYLPHEIAREMHTSEHHLGLRSRSLYRKLQIDLRAGASAPQTARPFKEAVPSR